MMLRLLLFASTITLNLLWTGYSDNYNAFVGSWKGKAQTTSENTQLKLDINRNKNSFSATITLMDMGVMGWPAREVSIDEDELLLRFPTDNSEQIFRLKIRVDENGDKYLEGSWEDTRIEEIAKVSLKREVQAEARTSQPLFIKGPEGELSAELILPAGEGPFPGVVFLHGSGPQPKDASRFSAYALASEGIASIIFDKRGVGNSAGEWQGANFEELARDGIAIAEYLSTQTNISYVGFFGHSQGGWIGPLASTLWEDSAFVISSAGPAVSPAREAQWIFIYNAQTHGATKEDIVLIRQLVEAWHEGLRSATWERYKSLLQEVKQKSWFEASGLQFLIYPPEPEHSKYYLPFMDYDPILALVNLQVPLFSILSPDDESIDSMETNTILEELKESGKDITIKLYPGYNHGFRRIGEKGNIRWPGFPPDYYIEQAKFIRSVSTSK